MTQTECVVCHELFERPRRRGRPPTKCENCKTQKPQGQGRQVLPTLTAKERVDRLEFQLKAEGKHISQHRKDDD